MSKTALSSYVPLEWVRHERGSRWSVRSHEDPNVRYSVIEKEDNFWVCNCKDWEIQAMRPENLNYTCKHILAVKTKIMVDKLRGVTAT